jgi:thiosulfate/3-mercaptopyruvate sulfurtransferase
MTKLKQWLVETDWLEERLDAPDLIILDGSFHLPGSDRDAKREFLEARIPGAQYFDINQIADQTTELPHMLPSPEVFSSRVRKMGIGDGARIIVYDATNMSSAARVWWMFRAMGFTDVAVLNGGFTKWRAEHRKLATGEPRARSDRHFTARLNSCLIRDLPDVKALIADERVQIADARSAARFAGDAPEPRETPRLGHIPGSFNVPFTNLLSPEGTLLEGDELKAAFEAQGIDVRKPVVTSCGSGVTACLLALGLATLGNETVAVYDGSWAEWSVSDAPVEAGLPKVR